MVVRLIILSVFTTVMILIEAMNYSVLDSIGITPLLFALCGLIGIWQVIWNHIRFQLSHNHLVIQQPFREARSFDLDQLGSWKQFGYNIRGQRRKTLVLFLSGNEKVVIDNSVYQNEFDRVYSHLTELFSDRRK